jgi:hypothetical protein
MGEARLRYRALDRKNSEAAAARVDFVGYEGWGR